MFGAVMLSAGLIVSASGGLLTLYVGHGVLMGLLGASCMFSPLVTYVSKWFDRRRGAAVALISSGQSVSGALWPVLFQAGIGGLGWRTTMMVYGGFVIVAILFLAVIFLRQPPETTASSGAARQGPAPGAPVIGLPPNVMMILLMIAVFCCCVPMSMPMQHVVAFCGDLGFASTQGAAMLSVLLGSAFVSRVIWGALADRAGGLQTLFWSSLAQAVALTGFLLTKNEAALFGVSAAFGLGLSGLLPAYVITIREYFPAKVANWRVPTVLFAGYVGMAGGGWGAGAIYDHFGQYLPAFGFGIVLNVVDLILLLSLVIRQGGIGSRPSLA
jgi:MFS family permease